MSIISIGKYTVKLLHDISFAITTVDELPRLDEWKACSWRRIGWTKWDVKEQNPQKKKKKVSHREMERSRKRKKTEKV